VARAVLASSAFPVAFTPITLKNYGSVECGYHEPGWVIAALQDFEINPTRFNRARGWSSYEDAGARPYVHLSDGGIADNIGLRGPEISLTSTDSSWSVLNKKSVERIAVIVVDAKSASHTAIDSSPRRPLFTTVLEASASNPIDNYSFDTVESLRRFVENQRKDSEDFAVRKKDCADLAVKQCLGSNGRGCQQERERECDDAFNAADKFRPPIPKYYEVHVQFDAIKNLGERAKVEAIPTTLELPKQDIELLKQVGQEVLDQSQAYRDLLADLRAEGGFRPEQTRGLQAPNL
jgi:NTE family protein